MNTGVSPNYLSSLIPATVEDSTTYNLRNPNNFRHTLIRTTLSDFYGYALECLVDNHKKSERVVFLDENKPQNGLKLYFSAFRSHMIIHMILYLCKNILLQKSHIVCYSAFFQKFKNL